MARLRATASAAPSVLDGCEHGGKIRAHWGNDLPWLLQFWQHAGEDFETEVLFVFEAVGAPLDDHAQTSFRASHL
jgi:hypothetical protein